MTEPTTHYISVRFQRDYREWLPVCTCGWVGSYVADRVGAQGEGDEHVEGES